MLLKKLVPRQETGGKVNFRLQLQLDRSRVILVLLLIDHTVDTIVMILSEMFAVNEASALALHVVSCRQLHTCTSRVGYYIVSKWLE